jgi:hypothetical protein
VNRSRGSRRPPSRTSTSRWTRRRPPFRSGRAFRRPRGRSVLERAAVRLGERTDDIVATMSRETGATLPWCGFNVHVANGMLDSTDEVVAVANDTEYGLSAAVCGKDPAARTRPRHSTWLAGSGPASATSTAPPCTTNPRCFRVSAPAAGAGSAPAPRWRSSPSRAGSPSSPAPALPDLRMRRGRTAHATRRAPRLRTFLSWLWCLAAAAFSPAVAAAWPADARETEASQRLDRELEEFLRSA